MTSRESSTPIAHASTARASYGGSAGGGGGSSEGGAHVSADVGADAAVVCEALRGITNALARPARAR